MWMLFLRRSFEQTHQFAVELINRKEGIQGSGQEGERVDVVKSEWQDKLMRKREAERRYMQLGSIETHLKSQSANEHRGERCYKAARAG